jgi:putative transferase (TIGR04331 family)
MFLATTAIDEFWDTSDSATIVFLGGWCRLYARSADWKEFGSQVLPDVWESLDATIEGHRYCSEVYARILPPLAERLNVALGLSKSPQYYDILLGNWLQYYLHQLYDKYVSLKSALKQYPDLTTWVLDPAQYYVPADIVDMVSCLTGDDYALQQYSEILSELGYQFPVRQRLGRISDTRKRKIDLNGGMRSFARRSVARLFHLISGVFSRERVIVVQVSLPDPPANLIRLFWESRFAVVPDDFMLRVSVECKVDHELRSKMTLGVDQDEFCSILSRRIFHNIPVIFLEAYHAVAAQVWAQTPRPPRVLFSAYATHFNLPFKFFAAEHRERLKLAIQQYGGGYGIDAFCVPEEWEREIASVYFTWGWSENTARYLPSPKLLPPSVQIKGQQSGCLLVMTTWSRYLFRFECHVTGHNFVERNLEMTINFCHLLAPAVDLRIRHHGLDYGWSIAERLADCGVRYSSEPRSVRGSVRDYALCIFDHLGTGYLETLAWNIPTIIFIARECHKVRPRATKAFAAMEKAGIVHYSPESAAAFVNNMHADPQTWWNRADVQEARHQFVSEFARSDENWTQEWLQELDGLAA